MNEMKSYIRYALSCLLLLLLHSLQAQKGPVNYVLIDSGDKEDAIIKKAVSIHPSPRQYRWQQLELTAFFHFGMNSFTGREWGDGKENPALFNPTDLDADQWVRICRDAGIKQVILTAKHHDGFCLWPSKYTNHSVRFSPWKNGKGDVVMEVAAACKKYKMGFGIYLSPWDRNSPLYGTEAYNDYFTSQLTELLTQYGKVDEVWFDGANGEGPNGKKQVYDFNRWYALIRKLQPQAVIAIMGPDVRWVGTESGYGRETEWSVVPASNLNAEEIAGRSQQDLFIKPVIDMQGNDIGSRSKILNASALVWYPAETDVSIRPGWFYHAKDDSKVKTPEKLLDIYFSSVGRNSVLLLNIPPDTRGRISDADSSSLLQWAKLRNRIFSKNLAAGARAKASNGSEGKNLFDGNIRSSFLVDQKDSTTSIEVELKSSQTFDVLLLQEDILKGQRVEKFRLEYQKGSEWLPVTMGTTIGYKRLLRFDPVTAQKLRLTIESSRLNPVLAEMGLYKLP